MTIDVAWRYANSGEIGFRRGSEVHVTDWGDGVTKNVRDQWTSLPQGQGWDEPRGIIHYPSGGMAFINANGYDLYITDKSWKTIGEAWPSLPRSWKNQGVDVAWRYANSGEIGFRRGSEVHVTDWGDGVTKNVRDQWTSLPQGQGWDEPRGIIHYPSGGMAFINANGYDLYITDKSWNTIGEAWPSLPQSWKAA